MKPFRDVYRECDGHQEELGSEGLAAVIRDGGMVAMNPYKCKYGAPYCSSKHCPKRSKRMKP